MDVKEEEDVPAVSGKGEEEIEIKQEVQPEAKIDKEEPADEWIEFETIAVTKQEWEAIAEQFAKSKHPDEKSLHQLLKSQVLPKVMADLEEVEKQRAHEAAMANRKRSSRIALKESEREEKERDRVARLKMEEKMASIRADEERQRMREREEQDAVRIREERLREREDRMAAREREAIERAERDIIERENRERMREMRKMKREQIIANGGVINESEELQQSKAEDEDSWELACEVCGAAGINPDDSSEIVCCETCERWQHMECWNAFDRKVGRGQRDWEKEDFFCSSCKPPGPGQPWPRPATQQKQQKATSKQTPVELPSPLSSPYPAPTAATAAAAAAPPPAIAHQRPASMPGTPLYPITYGNYNTRPLSSPNGQSQQWSQQQQHQQQYYSQQPMQQSAFAQQSQQQQHPYYSMAPIQRPTYSQQPMPQAMYTPAPTYMPYNSSQPQQQQYHQQPMQPQMSLYASPAQGQGHNNGYPYMSQATQGTSPYQGQVPPQHMQRPLPVQSHSASSAWPRPSDHGSPTMYSDGRRDMHAPPSTGNFQAIRPAVGLSSPQSLGASPFRPARPLSSPSPQAPIAAPSRPPPSPQASLPSPTRPVSALPSPQLSLPSQSRPVAPMTSSPGSVASHMRAQLSPQPSLPLSPRPMQPSSSSATSVAAPTSIAPAASPQTSAATAIRPVSALSSPQVPTVASSAAVPVSPGSIRSTTPSPKGQSTVSRNMNVPSGSFPLRRNSTAKSPLSRPEGYTSPSMPTMNLGPTIGRASSPTFTSRSPSTAAKMDPLLERQTVLSTINNTPASPGPGPSSGSLARGPQSSAPSQMTSVASLLSSPTQKPQPDVHLQQQAKTLGPSLPRPVFGAAALSPKATSPTPATIATSPSIQPPQQSTLPQSTQQISNSQS